MKYCSGILALALFLITPDALRAAWNVETIDSTPASGWACSLAISPTGKPHISYQRRLSESFPNYFAVYYATRSGSVWTKEAVDPGSSMIPGTATSIALTSLGIPVVAFSRSNSFLHYVSRQGGSWEGTATVSTSAGTFSSMIWQGTEMEPNPLIAYNDIAAGDQELAFISNGSWSSKTIESTGSSGSFCSLGKLGDYVGLAFIRDGKLDYHESLNAGGSWAPDSANQFPPFVTMFNGPLAINAVTCALAVAPAVNGTVGAPRAHVIFFNNGGYYYTTTDTESGLWIAPQLITNSGASSGYAGSSIAVGTDGIVRVALFDHASRTLKYGELRNGAWAVSTVDNALGGIDCSLQLDSQNLPRIAYAAVTVSSGNIVPSGLKFATFEHPAKLSFAVSGKTTRAAKGSSLLIKGTASSSVPFIQWRVGKKALKKTKVNKGRWSVKVSPLAKGRNKVKFRAISGDSKTPFKTVTVVRK